MQERATKTLPSKNWVAIQLSKWDHIKVEWGIWSSKEAFRYEFPRFNGSFYIEHQDGGWIPIKATFTTETNKFWDSVLKELCYKLGMKN